MTRIDVPLVCLDHGLRDPSSNKPYEIRPIEDVVSDPAVIEIIAAYASGEIDPAAAQAAVWHLNSEKSWQELAAQLTGTIRNVVREPYFSKEQLAAAVAIVNEAKLATADVKVEPRNWKPISRRNAEEKDATPERLDVSGSENIDSPASEAGKS